LHRSRVIPACALIVGLLFVARISSQAPTSNPINTLLQVHQLDLAGDGMAFLVQQAGQASFVLVGGLHGDNETQALVQTLYGRLAPAGFRYLATELSPWAAARMAASLDRSVVTIWGCDIEADQPQGPIRELAAANPKNESLQRMVEIVKGGYQRRLAPDLLVLARRLDGVTDVATGGISLRTLILSSLEVESERLDPAAALDASSRREAAMKDLFLRQYRIASEGGARPKVLLSFGQNHLHRGYDRRGVSTLGNFVAELAVAESVQSFHVSIFAAGGQISVGGLQSADQRPDEAAFGVLASAAKYPVAVFDMRPVREALHTMALDSLSATDANLMYWADSYDAIVAYQRVTPIGGR
jgi:hypothetical protein